MRLTFGCKSSAKIFNSSSEALCWIITNNCKLPYVIHLLDYFLTVTSQSSEKTEGPSTSLGFLGIILDSVSLQASLNTEKIHQISVLISNFRLAHRCTKRQLLLLLGHLIYAICIIPQGQPFLSHLLSIAVSVPSLYNHITLDKACKMELKLWHQFLSSWNAFSFFCDDHVTKPEDIPVVHRCSSFHRLWRLQWQQVVLSRMAS